MSSEFKDIHLNTQSESSTILSAYDASLELAYLLYSTVRLLRPSTIVETGVGRGVTSYYILQALEKNGTGHLYSIELPPLISDAKQEVGKFVPTSLRSRWTLIFGPGVYEMKKLHAKLENIDMFVHDSNHTYLNQRAEYQIALAWLTKGGILISDDVSNDALLEANEKLGGQPMVTKQSKLHYLGIIVNG